MARTAYENPRANSSHAYDLDEARPIGLSSRASVHAPRACPFFGPIRVDTM